MGIFRRMNDLLSANFNDLLDRCEDPEKMLRQAVREMESALGRTLDGAARAIAHERLLGRQLGEQRREIEREWAAAEAAVRRGDDAAAREALRRRAEHERVTEILAEQAERARRLSSRLRSQVATMRLKLGEARRRLGDLTARHRASAARRQFVETLEHSHGQEAALSNFDRLSRRVEQSEAETDALLELLGEATEPESFDAEIEAQLSTLKERTADATT